MKNKLVAFDKISAIVGVGKVHVLSFGNDVIVVDEHGSNLLAFFHKGRNVLHYDPTDIKHSGIPLCFPYFGPLDDGILKTEFGEHKGGRHGFIRDEKFAFSENNVNTMSFYLNSPSIRDDYPFPFRFQTMFKMDGKGGLEVVPLYHNLSKYPVKLSPGIHPYLAVDNPNKVFISNEGGRSLDRLPFFDNYGGYTYNKGDFARFNSHFIAKGMQMIVQDTFRVIGAPDISFQVFDPEIPRDKTIFRVNTGSHIVKVSWNPKQYSDGTIWRPSEKSPFICVEPSSVRNGINGPDALVVEPGDRISLPFRIDVRDLQ